MGGIRKPGIRLSSEPLIAALAANNIDPEFIEGRLNAAVRLGKCRGYFTLAVADEIACDVLKMHPLFIWGEEYENLAWWDIGEECEAVSA